MTNLNALKEAQKEQGSDATSESQSQKYSKYFPPKQEDVLRDARDLKSLASSSEVLTPLGHLTDKDGDWNDEMDKVVRSEESQYTQTVSIEHKKMSILPPHQKRQTDCDIQPKLSLNLCGSNQNIYPPPDFKNFQTKTSEVIKEEEQKEEVQFDEVQDEQQQSRNETFASKTEITGLSHQISVGTIKKAQKPCNE